MARKTSKEYRKEYQDLLDKTKVLEGRIKKRALDMCKKFPDVPICGGSTISKDILTACEQSTHAYIDVIRDIEEHNEKQSGYVQTSMYEDELSQNDLMKAEPKEFIEYEDIDDNYEHPERKEVAEILDIRLYCYHKGCNKYIKGKEGYNGAFTAETGQRCDLRNQGFKCTEHGGENESNNKKEKTPYCNCDYRDMPIYKENGKNWCPQCGYEVL